MPMCAHKGAHAHAHTWKRWLRALLIAHRWLFTIEKTESDRKWCSPCVVSESARPGRASGRDILLMGRVTAPDPMRTVGVLSQTACKLPCVGHPVRGLVSVGLQARPCQAPGERPRPAGESCCLLLQLPSSLSSWGTMHPVKSFNGLRCVRISLSGNAKPLRRVCNNHSQLVVSYKCICCFYWRLRWELFFLFSMLKPFIPCSSLAGWQCFWCL